MGTPAIAESRRRPGASPAPGGLEEDFDRLAFSLESQLDSLCAEVHASSGLLAERGERSEEFAELVRGTVAEELRAFARDEAPVGASELARRPAANLELLLGIYRSIHMVLWQAWFDLVENAALDDQLRRQLLRRGSDFLFAYTAALSELAAKDPGHHQATGSEQRRLQAVRSLLQGDATAAPSLGLKLGHHHLAMVSWGEQAQGAATSIAELLGRPLLAVNPFGHAGTCWAWLSSARPLARAEESALREFRPEGARVAIGLEGPGEKGFRSSHRQALRAHRFVAASGLQLLFYGNVAVEALAIENEEDARAFVAHQLRGIEDDSATSQRIRETLKAYFTAEHNAASAGAALGVHQQTVANRLRVAEERLGGAIGPRRVELEVALRLKACLDRD
jgi:DNA-binding PucR family transcriptional regulator